MARLRRGAAGMSELTRHTVLWALAMHCGETNGVRGCDLVREICGATSPGLERQLRACIEALRLDGQHVCGHPASGYYLAETAEELDRTCQYLHDRAIKSIRQIARMRKVAEPDLRGQLRMTEL